MDPGGAVDGALRTNLEVQRRTWEIELLISGAVVFTLLAVPRRLDEAFESIEMHLSSDLFFVPYLAFFGLKSGSYILILAFVTHLVARAFWIGLIGLQAAMPEGIDWSNVRYGPRLRAIYRRRLPTVPRLIRGVDLLASSIFSASSFFVLMFLYTALLGGLMLIPAFAIDRWVFGGGKLETILLVLMACLFLPPTLATAIDKLSAGKTWRHSPWVKRFVDGTMAVFYPLSPNHLTGPIQFTFFSRLPKKVLYPAMYAIMIGTMVLVLGGMLARTDAVSFHSYRYAHEEMGALGVDPDVYESLRRPDELFRVTPSIPSEIIADPYLKLFLPYSPRTHNAAIAEVCPDLEPLQSEGLIFGRPEAPEPEHLEEALRCVAQLYAVKLDGEPLDDLDLLFSRNAHSGVRGLVTYLSMGELTPGRHLLEVSRRPTADQGDTPPRAWAIPFWI